MAPRPRRGTARVARALKKRRLNADPTGYAGATAACAGPQTACRPGVFAKARELPRAFAGDEREATEPRTLPRRTMRLGLPRLGCLLTALWRLDLLGSGGGRSSSGLTASAPD